MTRAATDWNSPQVIERFVEMEEPRIPLDAAKRLRLRAERDRSAAWRCRSTISQVANHRSPIIGRHLILPLATLGASFRWILRLDNDFCQKCASKFTAPGTCQMSTPLLATLDGPQPRSRSSRRRLPSPVALGEQWQKICGNGFGQRAYRRSQHCETVNCPVAEVLRLRLPQTRADGMAQPMKRTVPPDIVDHQFRGAAMTWG
jgi:hypothetical protein